MWDMQNGLAGKASNLTQIRVNANLLLDCADKHQIPVFWSKHILPSLELTTEPFLMFLMKKQNVKDPNLLVETMKAGMFDAQYLEGLEPRQGHIVLEKSQPSFFYRYPIRFTFENPWYQNFGFCWSGYRYWNRVYLSSCCVLRIL